MKKTFLGKIYPKYTIECLEQPYITLNTVGTTTLSAQKYMEKFQNTAVGLGIYLYSTPILYANCTDRLTGQLDRLKKLPLSGLSILRSLCAHCTQSHRWEGCVHPSLYLVMEGVNSLRSSRRIYCMEYRAGTAAYGFHSVI